MRETHTENESEREIERQLQREREIKLYPNNNQRMILRKSYRLSQWKNDLACKESSYNTETQTVQVSRIDTDGLILDVGGGGEEIISRLNGKQVIAIDTRERELMETRNEALKVVMDAADLKFLPKSFEVCTHHHPVSLVYLNNENHT